MSQVAKSSNDAAYRAAAQTLLEFDSKETALDRLVHLTMFGIRQVEYHPKLVEALIVGEPDEDEADRLASARAQGALARTELENDFPLLHAQAVTTLWSALEASIRNLFASLLQHVPKTRETEAYSRIRVRVADYESLQDFEKHLYLVDAFEETLGTRRATGLERFEILFRAFGMSSEIEGDVVTCLLELYHLRNVIVHRHSKVDRRLLVDCSWIRQAEGEELQISHAQYHQYRTAISIYIFEVVNRLRRYFEMEPIEHEPDCACRNHTFVFRPNLDPAGPNETHITTGSRRTR